MSDNGFKIGEPVKETPGAWRGRRGKYDAVMEAAVKSAPDWVPITCENSRAVQLLRISLCAQKKVKVETHRDGDDLTLYVRVKP